MNAEVIKRAAAKASRQPRKRKPKPRLHKTQAARLKASKRWMDDRVENWPTREEY